MLYLILPPIIIIAALVALVYFFSRRFPQIEGEIAEKAENDEMKHARVSATVKRIALLFLERLAQWFKVMTLRAHNSLHRWTQSLKDKKLASAAKPSVTVLDDISDPTGNALEERSAPPAREIPVERRIRPMVSRQAARPEVAAVKPMPEAAPPALKNQLEDILVERIAANPRDLEAYERLGEYYMEQGNMQDAKECYRQVLRLSPVHWLAKIKIRRLEKLLEQK